MVDVDVAGDATDDDVDVVGLPPLPRVPAVVDAADVVVDGAVADGDEQAPSMTAVNNATACSPKRGRTFRSLQAESNRGSS